MAQLVVPDETLLRAPGLWVPGRKPVGPVKIDWSHPLASRLLVYMPFVEGYGEPRDYVSGNRLSVITDANPHEWLINEKGKALNRYISLSNIYYEASPAINFPFSGITFLWTGRVIAFDGANPGWFRTGAAATGSTFCIYNGGSGRPWVRINGTDVIKATSGDATPTGEHSSIVYSFDNAIAEVDVNGAASYSASHSQTMPTDTIVRLGIQGSSEFPRSEDTVMMLISGFLPYPVRTELVRNPYQFLVSA